MAAGYYPSTMSSAATTATAVTTWGWYTTNNTATTGMFISPGVYHRVPYTDQEMIQYLEEKDYRVLKKRLIAPPLSVYRNFIPDDPLHVNLRYAYALPEKDGEYVMPDGSTLHVDPYGNYKVLDQDAKVTYKANRIREFNRFINASELLEDFIRYVGTQGVTQIEVLDLPVNAFIHWLIWQAALKDGDPTDDLPPIENALPAPGRVTFMSKYAKDLNGNYRHGATVDKKWTGAYRSWQAMRQRCLNTRSANFHRYGGRGIGICERWMDFSKFLEDMGERPRGYTLERSDNSGDYCKENCCWIPHSTQASNRRTTISLTFRGKTQHLAAWARDLGVKYGTLLSRLKRGYPVEEILSIDKYSGNQYGKVELRRAPPALGSGDASHHPRAGASHRARQGVRRLSPAALPVESIT
jgi:hypothetical protein